MDDDREELARQAQAQLGCRVPDTLLDIWTGHAPADRAADVLVYSPEDIAERNSTYEIPQYRPDLLLIGDDGGGRGLLIARDDPDPDVILMDLGAVGSDDGERIGRLTTLAATGFRSVNSTDAGTAVASGDPGATDSAGAGPGTADPASGAPGTGEWPPTAPIDILITHRPAAGAKALLEIRRLLGLTVPLSQLTSEAASFPVVALAGVRYAKYEKPFTEINQRHGCLAVRRHSS